MQCLKLLLFTSTCLLLEICITNKNELAETTHVYKNSIDVIRGPRYNGEEIGSGHVVNYKVQAHANIIHCFFS